MSSSAAAFATAADDNAVGTLAWITPNNALSTDDVYTTATLASDAATHYLKLTDPSSGLSITAGAVISGIQIDIHRKSSRNSIGESTADNIVRLVKSGSVTGDNKAATTTNWPTSEATASYGGDGDLWGTTWVSTDFGSTFGVVLSANITDSGLLTVIASVDYMAVTVFFDASGAVTRFFPFFD